MIKKKSLICCLLFVVLWLPPSVSQAHKVRIFAFGEGKSIVGETAFSGGREPKDSEIIVQDAVGGKTLFTSRTDDQGGFRFPIPPEARQGRLDLRIIINVGDGHRGEWLLAAEEYLTGGEDESVALDNPADLGNQEKSVMPSAPTAGMDMAAQTIPLNENLIRRVVEEAMNKKIGPVKRMLAQSQDHGPSFHDILGGIGYILGLTGIAAYFKSKNMGRKNA
jgi:nickel transport protein